MEDYSSNPFQQMKPPQNPSPLTTSLLSPILERGKSLKKMKSDGISDGMAKMTHRTTFALDEITAVRLKRLAKKWQVSQAEVVRRSVEESEKAIRNNKPDPIFLLEKLHQEGGGLDSNQAERFLKLVREDRKSWRKE